MTNIFFSDKNYTHICNQINQSVEFTFGISIENNNKYQNKILDSMNCIYSNRDKFNIPLGVSEQEQSNILSNKSIRYFMIYFEQNLNKTYETNIPQPVDQPLYLHETINTTEEASPVPDNSSLYEPPSNILNVDSRNIIKDESGGKSDTSYIKYRNLFVKCGIRADTDKQRIIKFKDMSTASNVAQTLVNTNGGALVRDGWENVISVEITRIIVTSNVVIDKEFLLLTTDTLPSNITQSENLAQDIFAVVYHEKSSTSFSHYKNIETVIQEFEKPNQSFANKLVFNIETDDSVYDGECSIFIKIGVRIDHKFDK